MSNVAFFPSEEYLSQVSEPSEYSYVCRRSANFDDHDSTIRSSDGFAYKLLVDLQKSRCITSKLTLIQPKKSRIDRGDGSVPRGDGRCVFEADGGVQGVVDVEADLF